MDDRIKQLIGRYRNKTAVDINTSVNVTLDNTSGLLKINANPINSVIGVDEQFDLEREDSSLYRMLGRLNIMTANELTQGDDTNRGTVDTDWDPLFTEFTSNGNLVKTPTNWLLQVVYPSDMLPNYPMWGDDKPVNWGIKIEKLTSNNPSGNRSLLVIKTTQTHKLSEGDYVHINNKFSSNKYQGIHKVSELGDNGDNLTTTVTLETSWDGDLNDEMFLNRVVDCSDDDINYNNEKSISTLTNTDIDGGTTNNTYITVYTPAEHGLGVNDYVEFRKVGGILNGFNRVLSIVDDFKFVIEKPIGVNVVSPNGYTYRRMDGTPSDYYVRQYEVLTGNDYEIYPAAFSSSIYPETTVSEFGVANNTWLYHFNKDINTSALISHRGGIVNELKYCYLKKSGKLPYDWSNVTSHWDFNDTNASTINNVLENVSLNNTVGVGSVIKNQPKTITQNGDKYIGDVIEYNRKEVREKTITDVIFRFGIQSGVINNNNIPNNVSVLVTEDTITTANPNHEGYYYKPFKNVDVKKYSNIIEKAEPNDTIDGLPGDYETYSDGSMAWRDLLTDGFIEEGTNGVDFPFLNGRHYLYLNHYIYIRRQAPYIRIDQSDIITVNPKNDC